MIENANHLTGVAMVAFAATLCGGAFARLGQPAIIGYILAGAVLGPGGLGLVENREAITVLAELGVILLLYFVGMELSLQSFRAIWRLSITTAMAQIIIATGCMVGVGSLFGWPPSISLLVGFCLAISSTAVTIEVLDSMGNLRSSLGKLTIGILIAQDLAVGPMLLLLSGVHQDGAGWKIALEVGLSIAILIIAIALLSKRKKLNMPWHRLWATRDDLIPLAALTWCFVIAGLAGLLGLSTAFGAFLAGLVIGNSAQRHQAYRGAGPIKTVLIMVFFLSIGMLIDFQFITQHFATILFLWLCATVFKVILNTVLLKIQGQSWQQSLRVGLILGQVGEFSFVLAAAVYSTGMLDNQTHQMIVAVTVLSLVTSPFFINNARRLNHRAISQVKDLPRLLRLTYHSELRLTRYLKKRLIRMSKLQRRAEVKDSVDSVDSVGTGDADGQITSDTQKPHHETAHDR